jgi:hypothetical protein
MKKILIGIIFVLILSFSLVLANSNPECWDDDDCVGGLSCLNGICIECIDSDGGLNYYERGSIAEALYDGNNYYQDLEDKCAEIEFFDDSPDILHEYYCDSANPSNYLVQTYDCSEEGKNCVDGACVGIDFRDRSQSGLDDYMSAFGFDGTEVLFNCKDSDDGYDEPGKVACYGPVLDSAVILVDGCRTEGRKVFLREYFAEDCPKCNEYEILTGEYTINIYYEDYYCGSPEDGECLVDEKGAGYCTYVKRTNFLANLLGTNIPTGRFFLF